MKVDAKISLLNNKNKPFMGIGLIWLLERIKKFHSINEAAKDMRMSYSKAIKILNNLEKNLKRKVIVRIKGGDERKRTYLTSFGEKFIKEYDRFQKRIKKSAEKEFYRFMSKIREDL